MNRTKIEWCDYTINPVKGLCPVACPYCYARAMYKRFKWNPRLRYDPSAWLGLGSLRKPSRIFVGSTMELFHHRMNPKWLKWIMEVPLEFPQHTFIFLTKCPQNLIKWSPFPENCWVGVTCTNQTMVLEATNHLYNHRIAKTQFLSIEPLLSWNTAHFGRPLTDNISKLDIDWLIIGAQTSPYKPPEIEWVREIVEAADKAGIKVFLKDNLGMPRVSCDGAEPFYTKDHTGTMVLRQELPK